MTEKEKILFRKTYGEKKYKEFLRQNRQVSGMNTGTRIHKSRKDYNRQAVRTETRRMAVGV